MVMVCSGEKCSGDPAAPKENGPLLVQTGRGVGFTRALPNLPLSDMQ
jgi:hypothetical protein